MIGCCQKSTLKDLFPTRTNPKKECSAARHFLTKLRFENQKRIPNFLSKTTLEYIQRSVPLRGTSSQSSALRIKKESQTSFQKSR